MSLVQKSGTWILCTDDGALVSEARERLRRLNPFTFRMQDQCVDSARYRLEPPADPPDSFAESQIDRIRARGLVRELEELALDEHALYVGEGCKDSIAERMSCGGEVCDANPIVPPRWVREARSLEPAMECLRTRPIRWLRARRGSTYHGADGA